MSVGLYLRGQQSQENQLAKDAMPCQTPQSPVRWGWRRVARAVTALRAQKPVYNISVGTVAVLFARLSPL